MRSRLSMMFTLLLLACGGTKPVDADQDGWQSNVDCDDRNPQINLGAPEIPGDGVNNDCNLDTRDDDYDQDGFVGVEDCNDADATVPGPTEIPYDGKDNDCNELTFDDDLDGDGIGRVGDCDDTNPDVRPGLPEIPYDGLDNDCDTLTSDVDADGDGVLPPDDCDDSNPSVQGPTAWYADCDGDGYAAEDAPSVFACAPSTSSCGGSGAWTTIEPTGTPASPANDRIDCADLNANAYPGQTNFFQAPISATLARYDYDCNGHTEREFGGYDCMRVGTTSFCNVTPGFLDTVECGESELFSEWCTLNAGECVEDFVQLAVLRCR